MVENMGVNVLEQSNIIIANFHTLSSVQCWYGLTMSNYYYIYCTLSKVLNVREHKKSEICHSIVKS